MRHLAILWLSQVLSAMGDFFYLIAVMWIAVKVAGSGAGIVAAAEAGSMLLFGLLGGVYADRWNRRTTMIVVDVLRAIAVAILPILALTGTLQLWHLVIVAVVVGSLGALFDPALQASLPALSGNPQILQATNGLMDITRRLARALGPSLAGVLIIFLPLAHFFTLDAISFAVSALAVFSLGRHFAWKPERSQDMIQGVKGLLLAVPLFTLLSVPIGIALCASVMVAIGVAGLARFGFTDPPIHEVLFVRSWRNLRNS